MGRFAFLMVLAHLVGMSENLAALNPSMPRERTLKLQAFWSSLIVTAGALVAAVLFLTALVVSLPLFVAASATLKPKGPARRGWQELEPVGA